MFNLIMISVDWDTASENIPASRMFEYTDSHIANLFTQNNIIDLDKLSRLPCLFMQEGMSDETAYVGQIYRPTRINNNISFEYVIDNNVPPLHNDFIYQNRIALSMPHDFEFSRNHWAVKDIDLYRFLFTNIRPRRQRPTVFQITEHEKIEPSLVSVMMPFHTSFNPVYNSISTAAANVALRCRRADDIWENPAIIQDVVALIDRSRIVVCDCTGRNPNVFYEAGIAHTLGREVILIAQTEEDIPFDLRHLRHLRYNNDALGLQLLIETLQSRMQTIVGH